MINRRRLVALAATSVLAPAVIRPVFAQAWPTRPVHVIVPYAPGGSTDVVTRVIAERLSRIWGQQVVIENKPGAGTNFGAEAAAPATTRTGGTPGGTATPTPRRRRSHSSTTGGSTRPWPSWWS